MKQTRLNLGSFHRHHGDNNKPKTHSSNNAEQLVQEKPSTSKRSNIASPTLNKDHHHHHQEEEDNSSLNPNRKQSVITKVKEKAIKWRQTLARKKHASNENHAPAWGVALEDYENDEDQNAPKEEDPSASRIPALGEDIKSPRPLRTSTNVHRREQFPDHKAKGKPSTSESGKTPNPSPLENHKESNDTKHTKTLAEAVTEKLAPAYDGAIYELPTKNRTLSSVQELSLSKPLTVTPNTSEDDANVVDDDVAFGVYEEGGLETGVSVTGYIKGKLEDEGALWEVISKAIGPEMSIGDKGVVEKVKEVVTSLLQAEQEQEQEDEEEQKQQQTSTQLIMRNTSSTSPLIPISTNAYEGEEESQERILQAN